MPMNHQRARVQFIDFGRAVCDSDEAFRREWLVTNGIGGSVSSLAQLTDMHRDRSAECGRGNTMRCSLRQRTRLRFEPCCSERRRRRPPTVACAIPSVQINGKMERSLRRDTFDCNVFISNDKFQSGDGLFPMRYWNAESS